MASYPRRRSYGSGSVYRTADGRWRGATLVTDPATGRRTRRTVSGRTAADTRNKLEALRAVGVPSTTMRTGDWLAAWLPTTKNRVAPSTYRGYSAVVRGITDWLGDVPLASLSPSDVERMTDAMIAAGRSARTAGMARKVLRLALRRAVRDKLVTTNAAREAHPPKVDPFAARPLTAAEARTLIASTATDDLGPLWALLVATGLRQGEALALAWPDVDMDAGTIKVRRSLTRDDDGGAVLGSPKSDRSRRTIAMPAAARTALEARRTRQETDRKAAGTAWQDRDDLVFTDTVGRPLIGRYLVRALRVALARVGPRPSDAMTSGIPARRCSSPRASRWRRSRGLLVTARSPSPPTSTRR